MKKIVFIVLTVLWCSFIFYNSSKDGNVSNNNSFNILNEIKTKYYSIKMNNKNLNPIGNGSTKNSNTNKEIGNNNDNNNATQSKVKPVQQINRTSKRNENLNLFLRKNAHGFEYLVLAYLVLMLLKAFNIKAGSLYLGTLFFCLLYAVLDEFHQIYVSGRTSSVVDVLIDFSGAMISLLLYTIFSKLYKKYFVKKLEA